MHLSQASVARMQDLENKNWIILECIGNNSNTFRELVQNNATYFLSEFISNNTETFREVLQHKTLFVRVHIKQYWHIWRVTTIVGEHGDAPPIPWFFFETSPTIKIDAPNGTLSRLKNGAPPTLKSKAPFQEMILRRKQKKLETVINTCFTNKTTLEKDGRNSTNMWLSKFQNSKFRKKSETVFFGLANKLYDRKISWFHFMSCVNKNCLVLLRNFVNKPVE